MEDIDLNNLLNQINNENNSNNSFNIRLIEEVLNENIHLRREYHIKERLNPFEKYDENEFRRRFRFTKNEVQQLYNSIDGDNTLEPQVIFFRFDFQLYGEIFVYYSS